MLSCRANYTKPRAGERVWSEIRVHGGPLGALCLSLGLSRFAFADESLA